MVEVGEAVGAERGGLPPLDCAVKCAVDTRKQPVQDGETERRGVTISQAGHTKRGQPVLRWSPLRITSYRVRGVCFPAVSGYFPGARTGQDREPTCSASRRSSSHWYCGVSWRGRRSSPPAKALSFQLSSSDQRKGSLLTVPGDDRVANASNASTMIRRCSSGSRGLPVVYPRG